MPENRMYFLVLFLSLPRLTHFPAYAIVGSLIATP